AEPLRRGLVGAVAHVARGADAALPQPALAVEAVRVEAAVRALEAQCEQPAIAHGQGRRWRGGIGALTTPARRRVPAQQQARWHGLLDAVERRPLGQELDRKSTRLNSSHVKISYAVFCLKKK